MSLPNYPIVNAGLKYVNGLDVSYSAAKKVAIAPGACRDSLNINDIVLDAPLLLDGAVVGVNGVDQAAFQASKFYAVYVIADSTKYNPVAGLFALKDAVPVLPYGYDMYRRLGWVKTEGASNILKFYQYGTGETRTIWYDSPYQIGNFVAGAPPAYAPVDLSPAIPLQRSEAKINVLYTCSNAVQILQFLPGSSSNTSNNQIIFGCGVAAAQYDTLEVASDLYTPALPALPYVAVQVKVLTGDNVSIWVVSYDDYLE